MRISESRHRHGPACEQEVDAHTHCHRHRQEVPAATTVGATYTCPMHPEIRQPGPGTCPICGMALEPLETMAEAGPNPELIDMTRRFRIGLAFAIPVFVLEMGSHLPVFGRLHWFGPQLSNWVQFALASPVVLWAGWPFFQRGWQSLLSRRLNMFTLIALGTGAAYLFSVVATLVPGVFPSGFRGAHGAVAVYFEAAAVITVLVLLGQMLELRAREQTGGAIRALLNLTPKLARRIADFGPGRGDHARSGSGGRSAAGSSWRSGSGGWRGAGGAQCRR